MRALAALLALALVLVSCDAIPGRTITILASPSADASAKPISDILARIDPAKLDDHMRALASFESRHPLHPGHAKAVAYLMQQLQAIPGIVVQDIPTSYNGVRLDNIFATINPLPGSSAE